MQDERERVRYSAPAAELACRILRHLSSPAHSSASLTEIATSLGANTSSCLRVLRVLEREQFILQDKVSRRFSLGSYLYVLGSRAAVQVDFLRAALPYLREASNLTGLTCSLSQRATETELVYIAKEEPSSGIHISVSVGERFPIVAGSHGKCHLAYMPPAETKSSSLG